jgi:hypothetical protein
MRYTSRLGASLRYVFLPVVVLIFSFMLGRTAHGQAPGASSPQSDQRVTSLALPTAWNDGVKTLAEKIAAAVKPSRGISLEIKNISSLSASEVEAVRVALEKELTTLGLRLGSSGIAVEVTLSENGESYIWVAEIRGGINQRTAMLSVEKGQTSDTTLAKPSVVLHRDLIWEQSTPIMDFMIPDVSPDPTPLMLVLESSRIASYHLEGASWQPSGAFQIPVPDHRPRDLRGLIDIVTEKFSFQMSDVRCNGGAGGYFELTCNKNSWPAWPVDASGGKRGSVKMVQGKNYFGGDLVIYGDTKVMAPPFFTVAVVNRRDGVHWADWILAEVDGESRLYDNSSKPVVAVAGWGDEIVAIAACDSWELLVSGTGDWTERDLLRAYRTRNFDSPVAISDPLAFPGPIMALWPSVDGRAARVVSKNLQTGMYEASVVTVSCSQ